MCASTITMGDFSGSEARTASTVANGSSACNDMKTLPKTVTTKISLGRWGVAGMRIQRFPGALEDRFAGREIGSVGSSRIGVIRASRKTWSPKVTASAPILRRSRYKSGVIPEPFRRFSPLITMAFGEKLSRTIGMAC